MKNWFLLTLAMLILSSCTSGASSSVSKTNTKSTFQFLDYDFDSNTKNDNVKLIPEGIYAIDENTIFIFGAIEKISDSAKRTFILRSINSGQTWREVATPELSHTIYHLAFVNSGYGWALAILETNDVGNPVLFRSTDNGQTWSKSIPIKVRGMSFFPLGMKFTNQNNGHINFMDIMMTPLDHFGTLSTTDGGLTWQETFSFTVPYDKDFHNAAYLLDTLEKKYSEIPGGSYGNHWWSQTSDATYDAIGHDESEWHLYYHESSKEYILLRRATKASDWEVVASLPSEFVYEDGHIVKP